MYNITLKIGGIEKEFKKEFINVEDNLLAVEHNVRQLSLHSNEKTRLDPKSHRKMNEAYLQMFVDMYKNQFTVADLKQANMSVLDTLNDLYVAALGGKEEESEKKEQ